TFSKAYSLCFQRIGYVVGHPELIQALRKVQDSYSINGLGQVAALATLADLPYARRMIRRVIASRGRLTAELTALGFRVLPSETNFLLVEPPGPPAESWLAELRARGLLVRWFSDPELAGLLRISVGSEEECDALLAACRAILAPPRRRARR
ncbi:MAG: aminotransferase class I/II-fold pyridoxal phosphate-dependent enzyme, partial [Thermoleophilia bacterium]